MRAWISKPTHSEKKNKKKKKKKKKQKKKKTTKKKKKKKKNRTHTWSYTWSSEMLTYSFLPFNKLTHYENMPIQIYWKFYHQKMKIFR